MSAVDVGLLTTVPARRGVDKTSRIKRLQAAASGVTVKLSPTLVEYRPKADRRVIFKELNSLVKMRKERASAPFIGMKLLVAFRNKTDGRKRSI